MAFFGFIPSDSLLQNVQTSFAQKNTKEALYPLRDEIALQVNEEIIDAILTNVVQHFPPSDKKETAEKLAKFVKSSVAVLLKQLLGKSSNAVVQQSIAFSKSSIFTDPNGQLRMGEPLDPRLVTNLKHYFAEILAGNRIDIHAFAENYKVFAEATVNHYMHDFHATLDLGMIKRKAADIGCAAVIKAVHIAIDKVFPHLTKDELKVLATHHDALFFQ